MEDSVSADAVTALFRVTLRFGRLSGRQPDCPSGGYRPRRDLLRTGHVRIAGRRVHVWLRIRYNDPPVPAVFIGWTCAMPYHSMSLEEFAAHVGMDGREVRRLADRGKLPAHKVGGHWRFNRAQVTEWLQQQVPLLEEARLVALERAMGAASGGQADEHGLVVTDLIGLDGVDVAFPARTKPSALRELVKLAECTGLLLDGKGLLKAVEQRESLCSTALPNGVAIPHPRQPMPYVSTEPLICAARVAGGIGFGAPKGELTRLFFLICCHDDRHHLHILARLMRILDDDTVGRVLEAETREELLEVLIAREEKVSDRGM